MTETAVIIAPEFGGHHRRKKPDDHLCVCGRLRDDCVRAAVRALWSS